jgi:1,4-alpha-glucan branching enzyme
MREKKRSAAENKPRTNTVRQRPAVVQTGIQKQYLKSKNLCKVTFRLPGIAAPDSNAVHIVGEFNDWSTNAHAMKRLKNGDYTITIELEPGRDYQFRYRIDTGRWENDYHADKYVKSPVGGLG